MSFVPGIGITRLRCKGFNLSHTTASKRCVARHIYPIARHSTPKYGAKVVNFYKLLHGLIKFSTFSLSLYIGSILYDD